MRGGLGERSLLLHELLEGAGASSAPVLSALELILQLAISLFEIGSQNLGPPVAAAVAMHQSAGECHWLSGCKSVVFLE